jgi:prepilin-type N-terminal cleavage/methylation domain-containing protein
VSGRIVKLFVGNLRPCTFVVTVTMEMYSFKFCWLAMKRRGFSMVEMLFAIGLGGVILASAMALMLAFAHIHLSSADFSGQIERDIFAKKLMAMFLPQYKSSESPDVVAENLLSSGIFWESNSVPIFVRKFQGERILVGLAKDGTKLRFIWQPDGNGFQHLTLFSDVKTVHVLGYDAESDSWHKYDFSDAVVRGALAEHEICCLSVKRSGGREITIPTFAE